MKESIIVSLLFCVGLGWVVSGGGLGLILEAFKDGSVIFILLSILFSGTGWYILIKMILNENS